MQISWDVCRESCSELVRRRRVANHEGDTEFRETLTDFWKVRKSVRSHRLFVDSHKEVPILDVVKAESEIWRELGTQERVLLVV